VVFWVAYENTCFKTTTRTQSGDCEEMVAPFVCGLKAEVHIFFAVKLPSHCVCFMGMKMR